METIITRIGFCIHCHKERRIHINDPFLVYGSKGYHLLLAGKNGNLYGFVPTLYRLLKVSGENLIIEKCCSVFPCGVERKWKFQDGLGYWLYTAYKWERQVFTLNQWNGLVQWKHDYDYWIP